MDMLIANILLIVTLVLVVGLAVWFAL